MLSDKSPVFRKAIIPWYRSKTAYGIALAFMLLVFMFGLVGISVARENGPYNGYIWVPLVLVILSGSIIISIILRLIKRYTSK